MKAVCITRNFEYAFWLLRDFSEQCEDINLDEGAKFSDMTLFVLYDFL
jgi:hypothetical protein